MFHSQCDVLQELDKYEQQHIDFWDAMATVAGHELDEAQRQEDIDRARVSNFLQTLAVHSSVTRCVAGSDCPSYFCTSHLKKLLSFCTLISSHTYPNLMHTNGTCRTGISVGLRSMCMDLHPTSSSYAAGPRGGAAAAPAAPRRRLARLSGRRRVLHAGR